MRFFSIIAVATVALMTQSCSSKPADEETNAPVDNSQAVIENIMTRSSVRSYTDEPVSQEMVETMLRAAMAAPSAVNAQPWRFVVINERAGLDSIAANFHTMKHAAKAPLAVVVCGDMDAAMKGDGQDYWIQDASAATENLLLAAHGLGLGAVWCGILPLQDRVKRLSEMLNLPEQIIPLNVVIIGHPDTDLQPKDKWHPEYIHYNTWQ